MALSPMGAHYGSLPHGTHPGSLEDDASQQGLNYDPIKAAILDQYEVFEESHRA